MNQIFYIFFWNTIYILNWRFFFHIECFRVFYVNSHLHFFFLLHQYTFVNCILCSWENETEKCPPTTGQKSCVISPETVAHLCHFLGWRIYCSFFGKICLEPWFIFIDVLLFHLYLYIFVTRKFILGLGASESRRLLGARCVWLWFRSEKGKRPMMGKQPVIYERRRSSRDRDGNGARHIENGEWSERPVQVIT